MYVSRCIAFALMTATIFIAPLRTFAQEDKAITPDVVYGHKDGLAMTMDVIRPSGEPNGASIAFMVSGGWVSQWSPPQQFQVFFGPYLSQGYTIFIVRHGSSPRYGIPDAVSDVRRAIRFIRYKADEFDIDAEKLGVLGMSAGGHLSLVLATTGDDGDPNANDPILKTSSRVASVAALVPPSDLRVCVWESEESLPAYRNFPALDLDLEKAAEYSPLLHVSADDASALIISGTKDDLVPHRHGEWIADAYKEENVTHKLMLLEANHGLEGKQDEAFAAIEEWFAQELLGK